MWIPGILVAVATFQGIMLHEYAHKKACELVGLRVFEVKYFRFGNPAGYVLHEEPRTFGQALAITMAPLLINTLAEVVVLLPALLIVHIDPLFLFFMWLAISFGMHAIPSSEDAKSLWLYSKANWRREKKALIGFPIAAIVYLLSLVKAYWVDLLYALLIAGGVMFLLGGV